MLLTDPTLTETYPIPEDSADPLHVTFGAWPPREDNMIRSKWPVVYKPDEKLDPIRDMDAFMKQAGIGYDVMRACVRWGVRDWTGGGIESFATSVTIDGKEYTALTEDSIDVLVRSGLLGAVAMRAALFNFLSETERKKSAWRSSSITSTNPTLAENAGQECRNGVGSSGSTERSSMAARMT